MEAETRKGGTDGPIRIVCGTRLGRVSTSGYLRDTESQVYDIREHGAC